MRSIENELREIKRQQDLLYKDRLENKISEELFLRTDRTIGNRISRLERKLNEGLPVRDEAEAERLLNHLRGNTESLCTDKRVLGILINKITVYDKRDRLDNESSSLPAKYDIPDEGLILARFN